MLKWQILAEVALILAVFFIQGGTPVPDVNEPYYLGKAIHFWNPDWVRGDFFLDSRDTHLVYYWLVGWPSLWLRPTALAWVLRVVTWALLAWGWQRLSAAVVPRRWFSVLSAALMVCLIEHFNMAGEWIVGGAEAKGLAFAFVFFGLEALLRDRWNRAWLLLGVAAALHVLVGGWACVAAGAAWLLLGPLSLRDRLKSKSGPLSLWERVRVRANTQAQPSPPAPLPKGEGRQCAPLPESEERQSQDAPSPPAPLSEGEGGHAPPPLRSMLPGLLGGLLLSLPGLIPALLLNWGADPAVVREANKYYVYERFAHHLSPWDFQGVFVFRFVLLCVLWLVLCEVMPAALTPCPSPKGRGDDVIALRRLRAFVLSALGIALAGLAISLLSYVDLSTAAGLLRFYWFRLADVAVPIGVALMGTATVAAALRSRPAAGRRWLLVATLFAGVPLLNEANTRLISPTPHADRVPRPAEWHDACAWVAASSEIPRHARFLTPCMAQTFKWYTGRSEVVNWKETPQNADAIVEWWRRLNDIFGTGNDDPRFRWHTSLTELGAARLRELGAKYQAGYVLTEAGPRLPLEVVYENEAYVIYRLAR